MMLSYREFRRRYSYQTAVLGEQSLHGRYMRHCAYWRTKMNSPRYKCAVFYTVQTGATDAHQ
jgi:hypothetical protein